MNSLEEGVRVDRVYFPDGTKQIVDPKSGVKEMVVSMEAGQYGAVPWIKVFQHNGQTHLINCEKLARVDLVPIKGEDS